MAVSIAALPLIGAAPPGSVDVAIEGLRSAKGEVHACLTTQPRRFPDCQDDPAARRVTLSAAQAEAIAFTGLPSADYALAMIHDENGNGRLDTFAGIPREGFGFSRNPALTFGPPKFRAAQFPVGAGEQAQEVRVKYLL